MTIENEQLYRYALDFQLLLEEKENLIARLKLSEAALRAANEGLEQRVLREVEKNRKKDLLLVEQSRQAAMGEIIRNIAHQWRQPLNTLGLIMANLQDAYHYGELDQTLLDAQTDNVMGIIKKLSASIDDFRTFFAPCGNPRDFKIGDALREAIILVDVVFSKFPVICELKGELEISLHGCISDFLQIVVQILMNGKDALIARKIRNGRIDIAVASDEQEIRIAINDNAGGIPQDALEKIFDPYFSTKNEGTGLGLYMARLIAEKRFGGRVEVTNGAAGAEFVFKIPRLAWDGNADVLNPAVADANLL